MITAAITLIGGNDEVIWEFGGGLLGFYLLVAVLNMGVEAIRRFLDIT